MKSSTAAGFKGNDIRAAVDGSNFDTLMKFKSDLADLMKKDQLEENSATKILAILRELSTIKVNRRLLERSEIGLLIGKLKKGVQIDHENHKHSDEISRQAKALIKAWKSQLGQSGAAQKTRPIERNEVKKAENNNLQEDSTANADQVSLCVDEASAKKRRTFKSDGVTALKLLTISESSSQEHPLADRQSRLKSLELIYQALASGTNASSDLVHKIASQVEYEVYTLLQRNPSTNNAESYREKIKSLFLNLRDKSNPELKLNVLRGDLSASQFSSMTPEELKSKKRVEEEKKVREANLFKAQAAKPQEAETDQFKCGKCKQRKCRYYQMQTRSADEPMTTFVTCINCGNKWKFC